MPGPVSADKGTVQKRTRSILDPVNAVLAFSAVSFATAAVGSRSTDWELVGVAGIVALCLLLAAWILPWSRLPAEALLVLPLGVEAVIGLLRDAHGGNQSGFGALVVLPVVWVAFVAGRGGVLAVVAGAALTLVVPIVVVGAPSYPEAAWRGAFLLTLVSAIVGLLIEYGVVRVRRDGEESDRRASLLDRLIRTHTAIAVSDFGLRDVLETVVDEAIDLTGADAAVVEMPDGEDMVYRAVAGTAIPYLGLRVPAAASASGHCLSRMEPVVIPDVSRDGRVDRDACLRVGARSMVIVPLIHAGVAAGVLKVYSGTPGAVGQDEARVLGLLGNVIGTGLARAEVLATMSEHAQTDALTGLANRRSWDDQLARAIAHARRTHETVSVAVCDVDGLKHVNDTRGHAAGDLLIVGIARCWSENARGSDLVARIGGDEFAVLLAGADEIAAADVMARLVRALPSGSAVSFGIAEWDMRESPDELMARADLRMYDAKRRRHVAAAL